VRQLINNENDQRVKLDEILKSLFAVSKKVLIAMLNSLFKENFDDKMTEITFENNEFVSDDYDIIRGDLFLKICKGSKPYHYHIELQTKNDSTMVIRMFEYGFKKAKELAKYSGDDPEEIVIFIPKQLVIFVEENRNIKDELKMKLVFPDGQEVKYIVPTMKYWEYSDIDIMQNKMYPLLPLQVFKLRYKMEQIKKKHGVESSELRETIMEAKKLSEIISREGSQLFNNDEIDGEDFHKILLAVSNIFEYLNTKYLNDEKLNEEVLNMTKTLYDPAVVKGAKEEDAMNFLRLGVTEEIVAQGTGLSIEKIRELKIKLMN